MSPPVLQRSLKGRLAAAGCTRVYRFMVDGYRFSIFSSWLTPPLKDVGPANQIFFTFIPLRVATTGCLQSLRGFGTGEPSRHVLLSPVKYPRVLQDQSILYFLCQWESDLGIVFSSDQVERGFFNFAQQSFISYRYHGVGYKLLTKWYRVSTRLHAMYPSVPSSCWKLQQ